MEEHVLFGGQGWSPDPPCLSAPIPHSDLKIFGATPKLCHSVWQTIYFKI